MTSKYEEKAPEGTSDRNPQKPSQQNQKKFSWKSFLAVALVLVILWEIFHALANHSGQAGRGQAQATQSGAPSVPKVKPTPVPTVTLGGHRISAGGGAEIILNPGQVTPGSPVSVYGNGFRPKTAVTLMLRAGRNATGTVIGHGMAARDGSLYTSFVMPRSITGSGAKVVAEQSGSGGAVASAPLVTPGGVGSVAIVGKPAGKPGNVVTLSARGFGPNEKINVYWGRTAGTPAATLTADASGSVGQAAIKVGVAPVGTTSLVLVGMRTHTTATAPYQMLGLYPTTASHPWAAKAGHPVTFRGSGFAPGEQVLIYLNKATGAPALVANADATGSFSTGFVVPFGLKGSQRLTAIGSQSRAATSSGFDVLPYMPSAQASTYGALPGTSVSFYATGFAANEVVLVHVNGQLVSAFRVDAKGSAANAGHYIVPSGVGPALHFSLTGQHSGGTAGVKLSVQNPPGGTVKVPPQRPYVLPPSLGGKKPPSPHHSPGTSPSSSPGK